VFSGKCDDVFQLVMRYMRIDVPAYSRFVCWICLVLNRYCRDVMSGTYDSEYYLLVFILSVNYACIKYVLLWVIFTVALIVLMLDLIVLLEDHGKHWKFDWLHNVCVTYVKSYEVDSELHTPIIMCILHAPDIKNLVPIVFVLEKSSPVWSILDNIRSVTQKLNL